MKQIYHFTGTAGKQQSLKAGVVLLLMGVMLTLLPTALQAQQIKNFTQRTSNYSPNMPIYHIKGDYTMIGNTNLSNTTNLNDLNNYLGNNSTEMYYVDVDRDTFPTINSSTAALTFSEEFGANPACSEVLYAGLYWTGITDDQGMDWPMMTHDVRNRGMIAGYELTITGEQNNPTFTFSKHGSDPIVLTLNVSGGSGNRSFNLTYNGNTVYSGGASYEQRHYYYMEPNQTITLAENITINRIYWHNNGNDPYVRIAEGTISKNKIKIRHDNAPEYTEVEAAPQDIYYNYQYSSDKYIYAAYTEVTDYVRQYGLGNYTVADLLTEEGNGGSLGYFGCWGMVVVYENSKMKWRDITLFDGLSRVSNNNTIDIPISGFKTVQVGDVNMKLGMIAAEGDRGISGDRCGILKQADGDWQYLYHAGHTTQSADNNNFFNSSIQTGENYRHPNYVNNTGIDIAMFNIDNPDNTVIGNEQTSTTFRFKTSSDAYFPFCFVMGVDAYIPEAEALSGVMNIDEDDIAIDSETGNYLIKPGKEITFAVEVKNFGTEDIVDAKLEIPLPSTIVYYRTAVDYVYPGINIEGYYDAERYANGVAGWNIDYIPSGYPDTVYARVLLTVKVTEDCYVLASTDPECELAIEVNGTLEGTSYVNGVYFKKESFISGFADETGCQGNAIRNDIKVVVYKEDYVNNHCQDQDYRERVVTVCENEFRDLIPFMKIYALYPQGSRFFNATTGVEYTAATGFPISLAGDTSSTGLIHVQPTSIYSAACTSDLRFILDPDGDSFTAPTLTNSATYCLGAQADSLSRHIINTRPSGIYYRFYKERSNSAVAYVDIVPPTDVEGTDTFYVRQFRENAIGCEDDSLYGPITIKVVSPITFRSSKVSPSCIGDTVIITGIPGGGTWSYDSTLTGITVRDSVLTIYGTSAGTYTVTYTHNNPGSAGYSCTNTERSYTHQIAATTDAGDLQSNQTICQGAQIQPLQIVDHNGHVERWEWTTNQSNENWDPISNNTSSISTADLGELAVGTYYFKALVKDGNCNAEWTDIVTIEVTDDLAPNPPAVTSPQYACIGTEYTILPSGDNYQWYEQAIGGWPIKDADGNSANSVTVTITDEWITRYVSEVDNSTGCVSNRAEVQVRPNLEPGEINDVGQRECDLGQQVDEIGSDQNAVAYGEEPTVPQYQWYYQANGDTILRKIIGANSATYTPSESFMGTEGEYIFIRKAKNPNCDNDDWQQSRGKWRLVVGKPNASIEAVPGHATICQNGGIKLRLSVPASTTYSYQWYRNGDSIPDATGHAYIAIDTGRYTARVTHKASGCSATTPDTNAIEVKYDDDAPRASDVTTIIEGCSIEDARAVTKYSNVIAASASEFGFNIYDSITPVDSLKLTLREDVTEAEDLPDGVCYQLVRTYTVTDQCGFYTTFTHTINVVDDVAPSIEAIEVPAAVPAGSCKYKIPDLSVATLDVSSDNCSDVSFVEQTPAAGFEYSQTNTEQTVTVVVKVKDACNNETIKEVQITIPAIPTISAAGSALDCYGDSDGNISYTITGGTAGYTVVLSGGSATQTATPTPTAAGTYTFTGLAAGTYTVTVTDANGCTATASAIVDEPDPLSVSLTKVDETCVGNDGKINYTIEGGTAGYTVVLRDSSANQIANQTATDTNTFTGLKAGTYTVTVTDGNTCVATATATIEFNNNFTVRATSDTAICSGATFTVNPTASHAAQYSWSAPSATGITGAEAGTNASNISGTLTNTTTSATNITYTVTATTANGLCTATPFDVVVTVYAPVTGGSIQKNFIVCNGLDSVVTLTNEVLGNGGVNGAYIWQSVSNDTTTTIEDANGETYTPRPVVGTVQYQRVYTTGCGSEPSNTVSVTYYGNVNPGTVVCSNGCDTNYCYGSNINVTLRTSGISVQSGATPTIQWQQSVNGGEWTNIPDANDTTYTYNNANFTEPIKFRYTIKLPSCDSVPSNSVHKIGVWALPVVSIAEVATLCPSAASTDITGTIETIITPDYTYRWSTTTPNLTLGNLPASAIAAISNTIRGTFPTNNCNATYSASLYVVDGHGCKSNTDTVTFTVVDTVAPVISSGYADTVEATVSNCAYIYPDLRRIIRGYSMDNCTATDSLIITQSPAHGDSIRQTTEEQTLPVTVTVKDACNKETTTTIYVTVPAQLKLEVTHTDETCNESNNGTIDLTVTGGKENYTYSWQKDGSSYSAATQDLNGLEAATYTVTVADAHGCMATISAIINQPDSLKITSLSSASNCYNQADGYINYTFSGGIPDYTVSIGTATNDHATAENGRFTDLADGSYTVTVTDNNECTTTATTTIQQISDTLTITAQSNTWEYNGQPHTQPYYNVTFGSEQYSIASDSSATLANGDVVTATVSGSITNAGTAANTVENVTVTRKDTNVTCYYNIDKVAGALTITPKPVTITADDSSKVYDGTPLTNNGYTSEGLAEGDAIASVTVTGSITEVGTVDNVPSAAVIVNAAGDTVTSSYTIIYENGELEVTQKEVTITADDSSKVYDGTPLTNNGYTSEGLAEGDAIASVTVTGSITEVGTVDNVPSAAVIVNAAGENVTESYDIAYVNGELEVTPRPVTLTSATDSKIYDGTPLTNSTVTVGGDGFVTGEGATYDVTGTITNVGSCFNTFTYTLNSNTDANNYTITKIEGTLTILIDSVPPCIGCDPIAGVSCETIGNQTRTNDEDHNYYTHSGTAWDVNATDNSGAIPVMTWSLTGVTTASGNSTLDGQRFNVGVTTVTWTATDVSENTATCQFTVTVADTTAPVISCPSDIAGIACITDVPAAYADYAAFQTAGGELTDNDVVDYESFALVDADTNGICPTTITRTYYIEDTTGNSATCEQVITIKDSIAPALKVADSWPDNITGQDNCFANADTTGLKDDSEIKALYSDCSAITVTHEDANTSTADCGWTVTRTYTITDLCGNIVMPKPTMSVSGSDQTEPYIMPTVLDRTLTATGCEFIIPDMREEVRAISSDGCTGNSALIVEQPSAGMQVYPQVIARDTNVIIRVTDSCGNYSLKSVKITIPAKVVITATATPASICNGETAQLSTTVTNVVGTAVYAWAPATGLNSTTIYNPTTTLTATGASDTVTYTVMVTDANGCTATASTFVTVNPKVVMDTVANQAICHGSAITAVNFTTPITDGSVVYNWSRDNNNIGGLAMSGTGNIAAATLTNTTNTAQTTTITVTPVYANNGKTCTDETITFTITVYPKVVMDTVADQAICHGSAITAVNFSSDLSGGDITYTWRRTNSNIGGLDMSDTGNIPATVLTNTTNTVQVDTITVTPVYTNNGNECTDETITFTITVNPKVVMNDVADQAICHGSAITAVNFSSDLTGGDITYTWRRTNSNVVGLAMSGTGNIAATTLTNTTTTAQVDTIYVKPTYEANSNVCDDDSVFFTITVNPEVVMNDVADQAICHGSEMAAINFTTPITDGSVVYNWSRDNDSISGLAMSGTGNIPATVLTNTTNTAQVDTITVTPVYTNNGKTCTDETITFTITVNPKVVMDTVANQAICHGSAITAVNFTTPITDGSVVYNWSRNNDNISGLAMSGTGNIPATVLTNTTNTAQVDTITVTPVYTNNGNECTDESITFTITVNPKVVMNDVADQAICHGSEMAAVNFTTPITDGSVVYNWSRNNENIEGLEMSGIGNIAAVTLTNTTNTAQTTTITVTPVYTNNGNECTDESITFTITVNPEVVMNTVEDWTLCVGETSQEYVYTSTITDGTVTYGWRNDNSAIGLAASGTGNLPSFVAANATTANLIAEVKVAPTYTNNGISCQGDSINFHITVRPSITTPGNVAFTCPADTTVVLSYSECEQFVNIGYPEFVNNMTNMNVVITNDAPTDSIFPEGTTIVTWTATDECGAFLTCTQNVVVQFPSCGDSIADFDGYRYSSVRIGCQCWTGENARSEHYSDGTPVDNFRYYNDSDSLESVYGKLYSWYAAVRVPEGDDTAVPADSIDPLGNSYVQGICPEGWALPTVDEYMLMIANSGDATHAKDGSNLYWLPGYEGQPPFSGFDAYGAGKYNGAIDRYQDLLGKTYFWTTLSGSGSETATTVEINYYCAEGLQTELSKGDGVSIRCIRKR